MIESLYQRCVQGDPIAAIRELIDPAVVQSYAIGSQELLTITVVPDDVCLRPDERNNFV